MGGAMDDEQRAAAKGLGKAVLWLVAFLVFALALGFVFMVVIPGR
jgi:hypothetical protein